MKVEVILPSFLKDKIGLGGSLWLSASSRSSLFKILEQHSASLGQELWTANYIPHSYVKIYVNQEDISYLGGPEYQFQEGDEIVIAVGLHAKC